MSIDTFFKANQPLIEEKLLHYLTFKFKDNRKVLEEAILYSATAPAKRIRPQLAIASFLLFSEKIEKILPLCCAIEMVHAYSLIHDDLPAMDNDDYRRGQLTCHKKFGEDVAILAGDVLNNYALEIIAEEMPKYYPTDRVLTLMKNLTNAFGINGMAGGQALDILSKKGTLDKDYLILTHGLKTGAIIKSCITLPAQLEGVSKDELTILDQFGYSIGLLFQIVDDILDVKGSTKELGKSSNKDAEQNKLTYVSLWGLKGAQDLANKENKKAKILLKKLKRNTETLYSLVDYMLTRSN